MKKFNLNNPIEIATGIYWIGYVDIESGLKTNPYIIIEGDEAIVFDGGSRPDFPQVMLKIIKLGIPFDNIKRLIYHHYDPDLCGSIPNYEDIIGGHELKILSHKLNNEFIYFYNTKLPLNCIEDINYEFTFKTGRKLKFIKTPYSHSAGSFVTYDVQTKTLLSSDIFGSYSKDFQLYLDVKEECFDCIDKTKCGDECHIPAITNFQQIVMTSTKALHHAINKISKYDIELIAPQHGSLIQGKRNVEFTINLLKNTEGIGIDGIWWKL